MPLSPPEPGLTGVFTYGLEPSFGLQLLIQHFRAYHVYLPNLLLTVTFIFTEEDLFTGKPDLWLGLW